MGPCTSAPPKPAANRNKPSAPVPDKPLTKEDIVALKDKLGKAVETVLENSQKLDEKISERVDSIVASDLFIQKKGTLDCAKVVLEYE